MTRNSPRNSQADATLLAADFSLQESWYPSTLIYFYSNIEKRRDVLLPMTAVLDIVINNQQYFEWLKAFTIFQAILNIFRKLRMNPRKQVSLFQ